MTADFRVVERSEQCRVVVAKGQTGKLSEGVQDDVAIGIDDVVSRAFIEVDNDLSGAHILHLVQILHRLCGDGTWPRRRDALGGIRFVVLRFGGA